MSSTPPLKPIHAVQGDGLLSPLTGKVVRIRGVVTGHSRKGYFVQDPIGTADPHVSDAVFVFSPRRKARVGLHLELVGKVLDFASGDNTRPTTQIKALEVRLLSPEHAGAAAGSTAGEGTGNATPAIEPTWLTAANLPSEPRELARFLNGLEGMLVGIEKGATFAAPSNPFGDYVCVPPGIDAVRAPNGGVLVDPDHPERWLPGFRIVDYDRAPRINVGAKLLAPVVGPLNYRADAFQMVVSGGIEFEQAEIEHNRVSFAPDRTKTSILTLNGFNLDVHVEDEDRVLDADRDVDDDKLYGRFELLARAIVEQAGAPDIVALQEIQDSDGAELTDVVDAEATYVQLQNDIRWLGGPEYAWADIPPERDADGGQPGGNIRNAYLYNPARVELLDATLRRLGTDAPEFAGSRKPLAAHFRVRESGAELVVINVHLASKRHQSSIFAPENPGHDPREATRVDQARLIRRELEDARARDLDYYVTGDFNDFEFSATLDALCGTESINLVDTLPPEERFDYNHRGQLQVLMHGIVSKARHAATPVDYEILHGNELIGIKPGSVFGKATDHAYVLARIRVRGSSS